MKGALGNAVADKESEEEGDELGLGDEDIDTSEGSVAVVDEPPGSVFRRADSWAGGT